MTKVALPAKDGKVLVINGGGRPVLLSVKQAEALFAREENRDPKGHPISSVVAIDHPEYEELCAKAQGQ